MSLTIVRDSLIWDITGYYVTEGGDAMIKRYYLLGVLCIWVGSALMLSGCGNSPSSQPVGDTGAIQDPYDVTTTTSESEAIQTTNPPEPAVFNTIGGLPGNIANTSFWGFQGNTLYYTANYDLGILNLETGDVSKIKNAAGNYYQILGDYAFQSNLMGLNKINLKTGEITNLTPDFAGSINAVDGWLYYINGKDSNTIYKVDMNGQNREKLSDLVDVSILIYYKDQLYFNRYWNAWEIFKMNTDGSNVVMLQEKWIDFFIIHDDLIYISDMTYGAEGLFRFDLNGGNRVKLTDAYGDFMNVCGDYLFFINALDGNKLYRIHLESLAMEKVLDFNVSHIHAYGDYLYMYNTQDPEYRVHRMHIVGNTLEPMNMPSTIN